MTLLAPLGQLGRVISTPEDVLRLRMLILDLAVRGRLTEGSAPVPTGCTDTLPSLPGTWRWRTVADIAASEASAITDGPFGSHLKTEHYVSHSGYRVVRLQNIERLAFKLAHQTYISRDHFESLRKHEVFAGDLVIAGLVDPNLRCAEIPADLGPAIVKADCYRLKVRREMNRRFVLFYLNSPTCQRFAAGHHHGMTLTRIGLGNFKRIPVPVPPREEQDRIVSQVDRLLALCDEYESALKHKGDVRDQLRVASLAPLTGSKGMPGKVSEKDVTYFLCHSDRIATRSEHMEDVRRAILDLAVEGWLVRQLPDDRPSHDSLRTMNNAADGAGGEDHALPANWVHTRMSSVTTLITSGSRGWAQYYDSSGAVFVRSQNVRSGELDLRDLARVCLPSATEGKRTKLEAGDLLIVITGDVGHVAAWQTDLGEAYISQHVALARPTATDVSPWLLLCLRAPSVGNRQLRAGIYGGKPGLNLKQVGAIELPIPPLEEQRRILAKVKELMAVCDDLERSLAAVEVRRARALAAMLREMLAETGGPVPALEGVAE